MHQFCRFVQLDATHVQCPDCGLTLETNSPPERCVATCSKPSVLSNTGETAFSIAKRLPVEHRADQVYRIPLQHEVYQGKFLCRCPKCGWVSYYVEDVGQAIHVCPLADSTVLAPVSIPGLAARTKNFVRAYAKHLATGSRECSFDEILSRFAICSGCELYADTSGQCGDCGCFINLQLASEGLNKLAWQDSKCGKNKWGEIHRKC